LISRATISSQGLWSEELLSYRSGGLHTWQWKTSCLDSSHDNKARNIPQNKYIKERERNIR